MILDHPVKVLEELWLVEAWVETIGGMKHSQIVYSVNPKEIFPHDDFAGWTITHYRKVT